MCPVRLGIAGLLLLGISLPVSTNADCSRAAPDLYDETSLVVAGGWGTVKDHLRANSSCKFDHEKWIDTQDPYRICEERLDDLVEYHDYCSKIPARSALKTEQALLLRREQLKAVFDRELIYMRRFPPVYSKFDKHWEDFRSRAQSWLSSDPALRAFDQAEARGEERCMLHLMVGLACGEYEAVDITQPVKAASSAGFELLARLYGVPMSLSHDLIKAALLIDSTQPKGMTEKLGTWTTKTFDAGAETLRSEREIRNIVYGYYPELESNPYLLKNILRIVDTKYGLNELRAKFKKFRETSTQKESGFPAREAQVMSFLKEKIAANPLTRAESGEIEAHFEAGYTDVQKNLGFQIQRAKDDAGWLFDQDYLVSSALRDSVSKNSNSNAAFFQAQLCNNVRNAKDSKRTKNILVGSGMVLSAMTGIGGVALSGTVGTASMITSAGIADLMILGEMYDSRQKALERKDLFYMGGTGYSIFDMTKEGSDAMSVSGGLTLLSGPAMVMLRTVGLAKQSALIAGDLDRAQKLAQTERSLVMGNTAIDVAFIVESLRSENLRGALFGAGMVGAAQAMPRIHMLRDVAKKAVRAGVDRFRFKATSPAATGN